VQKIEAVPDGLRLVQDAVNAAGQKEHGDWTAKFDGKQYPTKLTLDGKPIPAQEGETVSSTRIDDHTFQVHVHAKREIINQARNVISTDGKTRTATQTRTRVRTLNLRGPYPSAGACAERSALPASARRHRCLLDRSLKSHLWLT